MIDGDGGFFMVCATMLPENYCWESNSCKRRAFYAEGGSMKKWKLSGVRRLLPLAVVPDIKESHNNFKIFFDLINLNNIDYKTISDHKAMLIALGLQTAVATYPCPYCLIPFKNLGRAESEEEQEDRAFLHLEEDHKKFVEQMSVDKKAKNCPNTVDSCLVAEDLSTTILEKYILPQLHSIELLVLRLTWSSYR